MGVGSITTYKELIVWQKAIELTAAVYKATAQFPAHESHGLQGQIQRATVSIASNIAEGWARGSSGDYIRFLIMARGSVAEVETQIVIAEKLHYIRAVERDALLLGVVEIGKMLNGMIKSLKTTRQSNTPM